MAVIFRWLKLLFAVFSILAALYCLGRVFVVDSFVVSGESMAPTYSDRDKIYVNKLLFGARIYKDFDFSSSKLESWRMPGIREIRGGDVLVVNYPYARTSDSVNFRINYVYVKRCIGTPGDTVVIADGYYKGDSVPLHYQSMLSETDSLMLLDMNVVMDAFQVNKKMKWTIKDFGPLYVPGKGDTVVLDSLNYRTYRKQIQYETGVRIRNDKGRILFGNEEITRYTFKTDWYFLGGDNVLNSKDSRYIGFIPEDYIVGIVM